MDHQERPYLIYGFRNKCPCGYVKLINPTFGEPSKDILEIGIYVDENFRKKGIVAFALNEAKKIFKNKIFVAAVLRII